MKSLYSKIGIWTLGIMSLAFTACDNADYKAVDSGIYLAETNTNALVGKKIISSEDGSYSFSITPRSVGPVVEDVTLRVGLDQNFLNVYNQRNGTDLTSVPDDWVEFSSNEVVLKAGETLASSITVNVKALSSEMIASGKKYVVPVGIIDASGMSMIADANSIVYRLESLPIADVPIVNSRNNIKFNMRQDYALTQWTVEFCVNMDLLGQNIGQYNNQAMFSASAPDGMDGEIYTRFGDAPIKGNIFQIKNQGTQMNSNTEFAMNTWYHIALVCDGANIYMYINGELDNQLAVTGKVTNLSKDKFQFGNTDYLKANAKVAEVRFWTIPRSQTQIKENMYSVDPTTDGLEAYWKMNEGSGNEFKDWTGHGNNAVSKGNTQWAENERLDGK